MENNAWKIVYQGDLIAIEKHRLKGYERAIRPPGVRIILKNREGKILITKEYRNEQGGFDYRLPGGKVFDELSDYLLVRDNAKDLERAVLEAAKIEAKEEAGVDQIEDMSIYTKSSNGASVEWDLYFVTGKIVSLGEQALGGEEIHHGIEILFKTPEKVYDMIQNNDIKEDRAIAVLIRYLGDHGSNP